VSERVSSAPRETSTAGTWVSFDGLRWASQQMSRTDLSAGAKLVLMAMATHIRDDRFTVWPSLARLAAMTGLSRSTVITATDALAAAGLIVGEPRTDADGRSMPTVYTLKVEGPEIGPRRPVSPDPRVQKSDPEVQVQDQDTRTSTARARQQTLDDATEAVLGFPVVGPDGPVWPLRQALVDELAEARSALAWVRADGSRRKTAKGMRVFLTGWLTRSNDRPRPAQGGPGATNGYGRDVNHRQALKRAIDASGADGRMLDGVVDWGPEADRMGGRR
jgi:hypothetical protein